eukprot:gene6939-biopygen15006
MLREKTEMVEAELQQTRAALGEASTARAALVEENAQLEERLAAAAAQLQLAADGGGDLQQQLGAAADRSGQRMSGWLSCDIASCSCSSWRCASPSATRRCACCARSRSAPSSRSSSLVRSSSSARGRNGSGRRPDAGRTIEMKKNTDADRTRAWPFLPVPNPIPGWRRRPAPRRRRSPPARPRAPARAPPPAPRRRRAAAAGHRLRPPRAVAAPPPRRGALPVARFPRRGPRARCWPPVRQQRPRPAPRRRRSPARPRAPARAPPPAPRTEAAVDLYAICFFPDKRFGTPSVQICGFLWGRWGAITKISGGETSFSGC